MNQEATTSDTLLRSVLVVDDNEAHRALIRRAIMRSELKLQVLEAEGLESASFLLFPPGEPAHPAADLVVLDLNLGDGRGTQLIAALRLSDAYRSLPVLVLSTSNLETDVFECYQLGANCYLTKSDDPRAFARDIIQAVTFLLALS